MRKILLFILLFSIIASEADAQHKRRRSTFGRKKPPYRYELIGSLGASNFLGDLGGANQVGTNGLKDLELVLTRPALGAGIRFKVQQYFSVKGNIYWGILRGDDKLTKEYFRNRRNINFKSNIFELSGQVEFNFIKEQKGHIYKIKGVRGMSHKDRQIYLFGGGGAVYFNPKGRYTNKAWYALQPLKTEGVTYSRLTGLISLGGGARFAINRYWGVGFELGMRKTFTDYMDDVSSNYADPAIFNGNPKAIYFANPADQNRPDVCYPCIGEQRGDHTDKDAYMFGVFTVGYKVMYRKRSRSKF
ncbi:MAG: hypothetical protein HY841_14065 [Bacteroidetes bacterium]|nr:hypothetical protein [Bacteroidota bacterium]